MVRVLKCHHFKSQNVVPVDGEPVAVYACQKWVFVATENFLVEVFQLDERESKYFKLSSFNTEAHVYQILFNPTGNYHFLRVINIKIMYVGTAKLFLIDTPSLCTDIYSNCPETYKLEILGFYMSLNCPSHLAIKGPW